MNSNRDLWWGEFELVPGKWAQWTIGPKQFLARSLDNEWRFAWKTSDEILSETVRIDPELVEEPVLETFESRRYAIEDAEPRLRIMPRLSNRPVIVRPETPLFLPPKEKATLYVSTGVWLAVGPATRQDVEFFEIPVFRGSDTWFGPNTIEGELCYASLTSARTEVDLLAKVPHRAFTPVEITNKGEDSLQIEALRVPVTLLSIYAGSSGRLWTDKITFEREQGESAASLRISSHEAMDSVSDDRLSEPRQQDHAGIVHSFSKIFSKADS